MISFTDNGKNCMLCYNTLFNVYSFVIDKQSSSGIQAQLDKMVKDLEFIDFNLPEKKTIMTFLSTKSWFDA